MCAHTHIQTSSNVVGQLPLLCLPLNHEPQTLPHRLVPVPHRQIRGLSSKEVKRWDQEMGEDKGTKIYFNLNRTSLNCLSLCNATPHVKIFPLDWVLDNVAD